MGSRPGAWPHVPSHQLVSDHGIWWVEAPEGTEVVGEGSASANDGSTTDLEALW